MGMVQSIGSWPCPATASLIWVNGREPKNFLADSGEGCAPLTTACRLSSIRGSKPLRFRCQVGHSYTSDILAKEQESAVDEALRVALRVIEERAELVTRMAEDGRRSGRKAVAEMYDERAVEYRQYAETLRRAVLLSMDPFPAPSADEGGQGNQG